MKKPTINQILIWIAQFAVVAFTLPTVFGFFISPNGILTLDGSYFLIPIVLGLIGYSIIGQSIATIVMVLTGIILAVMYLCVLFFKRALKYGVFLFAILLLDLTTLIAWFKGEIFEVGYVTANLIIHLVVIALLIAAMVAAYYARTSKQQKESEKEDRAEAEVEFEVERKLDDPQPEPEENTVEPVSDEGSLDDPQPEPEENTEPVSVEKSATQAKRKHRRSGV